jgi:ferrous iron transport protein B
LIIDSKQRTEAKTVNVAIAGNPNSGKTTLFNGLTGSNQRIGNWPGVTVEKLEGCYRYGDSIINVVDLPGIYSLSAYSEDEHIARGYLLGGNADLVVNIVDATNMERNLYLTAQLVEMRVPLVIVLNMMDLAERGHLQIETAHMESHFGCPVIPVTATRKGDIERLRKALYDALQHKKIPSARVSYSDEIEEAIAALVPELKTVSRLLGADERWTAVKIIEDDRWVIEKVLRQTGLSTKRIEEVQQALEKVLGEPSDHLIADYRYGFTHGIVRDVVSRKKERRSATDRIDKVVLSRILGIPIFLVVMYVMFFIAMNVGGAFIDFFDILFGTVFVDGLSWLLGGSGAPDWLVSILAGGVGGGIQTMATFIPVIFMMFFMLSLLEDSGYMARAAFVMDRFMRWIGLPGKAFVPLLVGFGCTVPAIMAARTMESRRDRLLTVFITPLMSCGARFPVYALFATAFFARGAQNVIFSIYMIGIVLAILTGLLLKKTLFRGDPTPFVMELPPYHSPRIRHIMHHSWHRLNHFLHRARVLIPMIVFLTLLNSVGIDGSFGRENTELSALSRIGRAIVPVFRPMGIDDQNWPASVALFSGLFAKEAVVGTLNALYSQEEMSRLNRDEADDVFSFRSGIISALRSVPVNFSEFGQAFIDPLGVRIDVGYDPAAALDVEKSVFSSLRKRFTGGPAQAYAYMLFILIYVPCLSAVVVTAREIGIGLTIFSVLYLTALGWIVSTLFYQLTVGYQIIWILLPPAMIAAMIGAFIVVSRRGVNSKTAAG